MSLRSKEIKLPDNIVPFSSTSGQKDVFRRPTLTLPETYLEPLIKIDTEPAFFAITEDDLPLVQKHIDLVRTLQVDTKKTLPEWFPIDMAASTYIALYFSATGQTNKQIANQIPTEDGKIGVAESTIKNRLTIAYQTLGVDTGGQAIIEATKRGIIDPALLTLSADMDGYYLLTPRQRQIYSLIARRGYTNKEIASQMHLAESTVKNQLSSTFPALGVSQRDEIIMYEFHRQRNIVERAENGPFDLDIQKSAELFNIDLRFSEANKQLYKFFDATSYPEAIATAAFIGCFDLKRHTGITDEQLEEAKKLPDDYKSKLITIASQLDGDILKLFDRNELTRCAKLIKTSPEVLETAITDMQQKLAYETPMQALTALFYERLLQYKQQVAQGQMLRKALKNGTAALALGENSIVLKDTTYEPAYHPPTHISRRVV